MEAMQAVTNGLQWLQTVTNGSEWLQMGQGRNSMQQPAWQHCPHLLYTLLIRDLNPDSQPMQCNLTKEIVLHHTCCDGVQSNVSVVLEVLE